MVAMVVAAGVAAVGGGDVTYAGLVLQQGYVPGEHHTSWTQNSQIQSCRVYISIYTYSHEHNNITISSSI